MADFLTQPGFFGTKATLRSDLTLVLIIGTAVLFSIGMILARRRLFTAHHRVQIGTFTLNSLVVLISMVSSFVIHILPGIPGKLRQGDYAVTTGHGIVGALTLIMGLYIILGTQNLVPHRIWFVNYRKVMRLSFSLYMISTLFGILLYFIVFILGI